MYASCVVRTAMFPDLGIAKAVSGNPMKQSVTKEHLLLTIISFD